MRSKVMITALVAIGVAALWAGTAWCGEGDEAGQPAAPEMPPPPPQLENLDAFVGQWRGAYEFMPAMFGESGKGTGATTYKWVLDHRFLMAELKATGSFGEYESMGMMTYDPMMQAYRWFEFDVHGMCNIAVAAYEKDTETWTFTSNTYDMDGKPAKSKYRVRFADKNTMEWEWFMKSQGASDFAAWMKGTKKRISAGK